MLLGRDIPRSSYSRQKSRGEKRCGMSVICRLAGCVTLCVVASACATQPAPLAYDPPGFFSGLVHGFLVFFSLIGSLFWDIRVYAFPNSGWWYDLGFFFGFDSWGGFLDMFVRGLARD